MSIKGTNEKQEKNILTAELAEGDFRRLSAFIYDECGIHLPPSKKTMIEGRLRKRLRALGMSSFGQYCDYLFSPEGMAVESIPMIDMVTTNKTDFFREPEHFDHLVATVLPGLVESYGLGIRRELKVWSAACSSGEEPYTLAMVLSHFGETCPGFRFSILATDISTVVLEKAMRGIYDHDRVEPVPLSFRKKYLMRNKDKKKPLVRIAPELRAMIKFRRLNLMDDNFGIREPMAIIFCRNVII
jgi:chemotaxis protein methyltransferase CheR